MSPTDDDTHPAAPLIRALGPSGENLAAEFLCARGCRILQRNFRCRFAEIDLIVDDQGVVAFVEVKTRRGDGRGSGMEAVSPAKRRRIVRAALMYVQELGTDDRFMRFDVVAVDAQSVPPRIEWLKDAFRVDG